RTIQNDIYKKLLDYPIEKDSQHRYKFTEGYSLNKTSLDNDEMIVLQLSLSQFRDVRDFNKIQNKLFKKLLTTQFTNPYYIKQEDIEDIDIDSTVVESLEKSIENQYHVLIISSRGDIEVEPYKITAYDGIWYLFAKDEVDQKVKTFMLSRIKKVKTLSHKHKITPQSIEQILEKTHSAWYDDGITFKVKVKVYKEIASYFKQKEFLQSQIIEEELDDGSLIVSFNVTHDEDCDNMIKSWLPHIEVLEPLRFRKKIKNELTEYLKKIG
ncbi:helix-turn-helix transcriptional regulator, partial [Poseidonibacter sp.]|uniref:helix-turn-helix transcriptional regulator n=1 Tax=Poseidonibacter sp. TaxID=2321188 RepID=UPI003C70FDA2